MSNFTRRDLVRIAAAAAAAGTLETAQAQHVHEAMAEVKSAEGGGPYTPKALTEHEYATMKRLSELIMPADEISPSAVEAGAPEFIDFLCSNNDDLKAIYTGGIGWLDNEMSHRYGAYFVDAKPADQTALLDLISYRKNASQPELAPGVHFFHWARMLVVDAFYTSKYGPKDVGFMGNKAVAHFEIPKEAIEYALKRSPV